MTITATSILASVDDTGKRIDTLLLRYPRFIHAEELTHRVILSQPECLFYEAISDGVMYCKDLSRGASSSRAIPVLRMIADVMHDPAEPLFWGANQPGMQATQELTGSALRAAQDRWNMALSSAIEHATALAEIGAHKQIVNRILEPFAHINVVVTATEWDNFFALRDHEDAQPEIRALAKAMKIAMLAAPVQPLDLGHWHLPFVSIDEIHEHQGLMDPTGNLRVVSSARCARTSYLTHDGRKSSLVEDVALGERLTRSRPFHASPFENQATPYVPGFHDETDQRNFRGWVQNRALMEKYQ
ncbi:FAD-dependent thymidylate synthase [Komagataeibacter saccharivorans]|uniref:FAD-dependent thymidylate synthase n=1 Tax=Komagataeibacter saccharivorans TaxID=265959 RepID=UPI000C82CB0E|nr:FAD-dependent thymidylate synthase [Komagataeibacter saccharivorans]